MVGFYIPGMTNALYNSVAPRAYVEEPTPVAAATNVPAAIPAAAMPASSFANLSGLDLSGLDLSGLGYQSMGLPANYTPTPNYLVKPTRDLDPTTVGLQTVDGLSGLQFVTNKGNAASIKAKEIGKKGATATSTGFVPLVEDAQYRIINEKGKDRVLYTGAGEEGLKNVYAMAQDLSATKGKKANWGVEMLDPATGQWSRVADDDPAKKWTSVVGDVIGTALPIAVQFIPGVGPLATIGLTAAAGGAGAALAGRDPLKGAVMGGLSAAGGQLLGPALQGAGIGANAATAIGTGLGTTAGGLATGQNLQNALLGGVAAGGLSYLGGEVFGPKSSPQTGADVGSQAAQQVGQEVGRGAAEGLGDLVVTAAGLAPNLGLGGASLVGGGSSPSRQQQPVEENQTVVTAARQPTFDFGAAAAPALAAFQPSATSALEQVQQQLEQQQQQQQQAADENQLTVTAANGTPINLGTVNVPLGGAPSALEQVQQQLEQQQLEQQQQAAEENQITVTAADGTPINLGTVNVPSLLPSQPPSALEQVQQQLEQQQQQAAEENQITVTAADGTPINLGTVNVPIGGGGGLNQTSPTLEDPNITVTAKEETPVNLGTVPTVPTSPPPPSTPPSTKQTTDAEKEEQVDKDTKLDDIIKYLRLAGLGVGLIGDLVGGGGSNSQQGVIPAGFGKGRSPIFSATLPAANMPGLAAGAGPRTAADLAGQGLASNLDYYRYGYGPEQSFRTEIAAAPRNTSTAYTGYEVPFEGLEKMARGGFAVGGPGDGRDDKIPAMLSDGEYVIDAETVAMLGNGSTKAGADALDNFRVNIRKHKGRALSKGKFSDNAKKPEQYLKKGRR